MADTAILRVDMRDSLGALERPRRVPVSVGAAESLVLDDAGGYTGPWDRDSVPYMIEPMDMLASRHHSAVVFVGPARSGKTAALILGWMAHAATNDIGRMMIMHMTKGKSDMLSKLDIEPAINASEKLRALKSPRARDNTIGLKVFKHGMAVRFAYPSRSEMAGTTYRYVAMTDYDRFTEQKGMGGSIFDSAGKRTQTLMSRGKVLAESSPERKLIAPGWTPSTPHEAPPVGGIIGLYNRSDRRRWYWQCPECMEWFEAKPGLDLFSMLPTEKEILEEIRTLDIRAFSKEMARVVCPHCASLIEHASKHAMNAGGKWLAEGQTITSDGEIIGEQKHTGIAGYWLGGVAASYQSWSSILENYLQGLREYALTGSEATLEAKTYVDQAMPYTPRHLIDDRINRRPEDRTEPFDRYIVPAETRFIVAAVDVQGGSDARFVVQVHAIGAHLEQWLIDRYEIKLSERPGVDGGMAPIDPASYLEDWDLLTKRCVLGTYRIADGREMRIRITAVDTGGEDGVTANAYSWFRSVRDMGHNHRLMLVKGASARPRSVVAETMVGTKNHKAKPDIPLYLLGTNDLKDAVSGALQRETHGPGYIHFPQWLHKAFFDELQAEIRDKTGKWVKIRKRNEAFDLCAYIRAACIRLGADRFNWADPLPPNLSWANMIDDGNVDVISPDARRDLQATTQNMTTRRVSRSNYARR